MAKYKASIMTMTYPRNATIEFTSRARTHDGVLRALAKAIARELHDDAIAVRALFVYPDGKDFGFMKLVPISMGDEHQVFLYVRDALFDLMY